MTMPGDGLKWAGGESLLGANLTAMVINGTVPFSRLDDMALRIVASWYKVGQDSPRFPKKPRFSSWFRDQIGPLYPSSSGEGQSFVVQNYFTDPRGQLDTSGNLSKIQTGDEDHAKVARQIAAEGMVLLKNVDGALPLSGRGRGRGPYKEIGIFGSGAAHSALGPNGCFDRSCNMGALGQGWGSGSVEYSYLISPLEAIQARAVEDRMAVSFVLQDGASAILNSTAAKVGKRKDDAVCVVFVTSDSGEGYVTVEGNHGDRNDLKLWHDGDQTILAVAENCRNTVVVMHSVGPVLVESWVSHPNVKAILLAHLPGQESGTSLVDVLYGDVTPCGHLPYTIGKSLADYGPQAEIMWEPNWEVPQQDFTEGIFVDYKWFDKHNITPRFEFGYGESYTSFNFSQLVITTLWPGKQELPEKAPEPETPQNIIPEAQNSTIPAKEDLLFPTGWKSVDYFVYPYLPSPSPSPSPTTTSSSATPTTTYGYYPPGYDDPSPSERNLTSTSSSSGGYQGGNPSLWDTIFRVQVLVTNTGAVGGKIAVQLYLGFPDGIGYDVPVRQLRGFEKVELAVGESSIVEFALTRRDISVWSEDVGAWVVPRAKGSGSGSGMVGRVGRYKVFVGGSSRGEERGAGVVGFTETIPEEG